MRDARIRLWPDDVLDALTKRGEGAADRRGVFAIEFVAKAPAAFDVLKVLDRRVGGDEKVDGRGE